MDPTRCATNPQVWLAQFEAEFPASEHVSIGLDRPDDHGLPPPDALAAARLECSTDTVLTAGALQVPRHVNDRAVCRPIGDNDWAAALALRTRVDSDGPPTPAMRVFLTRAVSAERQATRAGGAVWFGGFVDGELLSSLGVVATGGVARYQNVVTDPSARRQGLAGMLVHRAGWFALRQWGVRRLVIVAEPDSDAIRLYHALGFVDAERQVALERAPRR